MRADELIRQIGDRAGRDPGRSWRALALVFIGGFFGSILRELMTPALPAPAPWAPTLLINTAACLIIGGLYGARKRLHPSILHFAAIGFCGGLSTFSHFVQDVQASWIAYGALDASLAIGCTIVFGLAAALVGEAFARRSKRVNR